MKGSNKNIACLREIIVLLTLTRFAALAAEDPSIFPKKLIFESFT